MKNQENDIAKQRDQSITFVFEQQDNVLIINAQTDKVLYVAKFLSNQSYITVDDVKESLEQNNFKIVQKNSEVMKLKIAGVINLDFKSKDKLTIDQLRSSIQNLTQKLEAEIQKNHQLSQITNNLQAQIHVLEQKLNQTQSVVEQLQRQLITNHQEQSQTISSLNETIQEHRAEQQEKNNLYKGQIQEQTSNLNRRTQLHDELKTQLITQINQHKELMETANQDHAQKITNLTTQLTQLRTEFNQLITQTIPKCLTLIQESEFMRQSRVVCSPEEKNTIRKFFENKTIKCAKLLYKASDNDFCIKRFHEKCDGIANTLTVITTEFNKKIGGFTPLKWKTTQSDERSTDNEKESFIFSLTHNDKFTLQQPDKAIQNYPNWGPKFGSGFDLMVCDKSNSTKSSGSRICKTYHNQKYKYEDVKSYERFHGGSSSSDNFKILEW